ncbi:Hypothetical predicted protein [Olea europaea subsp. europaea]|uniref:Uncharacterized protein n=1 Tax=Olea europaea subsp. europaea TaxID=158383 RepID=A0A8S0UGU8_OLEEU|nr:Hypothetical predicted protein [Olea europaea subsp. europaea]
MLVATKASHLIPTTRIKLVSPRPNRNPILSAPSSVGASLSTSFLSPFVGGSVLGDFSGLKIRPTSLNPYSFDSRGKRGVVTMTTCYGRKTVLVAIYVEKPRRTHRYQHQHRYDHFPQATHVHNNGGYNRKAELLKYTKHLRESNHSAGASSITCMKRSPKIQITPAAKTTRKPKSGRTPTYVGKWKFLLPNFFGCMASASKPKKKKKKKKKT